MLATARSTSAVLLWMFLPLACTQVAADGETSTESSQGDSGASSSSNDESTTGAPDCAPTLESVRDTIFVPRCGLAGCHGSVAAAAGLRFDAAADLLSELVNVSSGTCDGWVRIVPGDAESSFLYDKLSQATPACGDPMPPGPSRLSDAQLECIAQWIATLEGNCETCGGDACVDVQSDPLHCGACDSPCPSGVACVEGSCDCGPGNIACDDSCVTPLTDPMHCGGCGVSCGPDEVCFAGICAADCGQLSQCGQSCVNLDSDPEHCGDCDMACAAGQECVGGQCGCGGDPVSFSAQIEPLLDDNCAGMGCHSTQGPKEGLILQSGQSYAHLVGVTANQCNSGVKLVEPGAVDQSYLINKLLGVGMCKGNRMPKADAALPAATIDTIEAWICQGAPNN